ncbi:cobyric acid synthase [Pararhizobium haloflavum]|uniref:cobyric acid synthase n=1 Tax=Pararhizobium haloflavum TaxID=2037914 RepID=UPI000C183836|nr:cobyric acid synthase [Pararhizobium haloflavum]
MTRAIMLQGTGSDVGKTVLVAGLCRLAANRGLTVRPFKPQNMSNNAAVADDGGEIGRAQWLQSMACRTPSSVHMNPVLLKPESDTGSQIVVQGKVFGRAAGRDYQKLKPELLDRVAESFSFIEDGADLVLVEGAGSPAEINLRAGDIANMGFAERVGVPVVLVGDIDRGGVIASLVGTHAVLPEADRKRICGFLINKFRGDISLFDTGLRAITDFTGWPSFGVVPWLAEAGRLPPEDSVVLERMVRRAGGALKVAVPVLSRIANFDDLDPLAAEPDVELVYVRRGESIPQDAGLVVLPGSKSTIGDLAAFRSEGWDVQLSRHVRAGRHVLGLCGGYQMLGRLVADPCGVDGARSEVKGLGLLDIETTMAAEKTVRQVNGQAVAFGVAVEGYEIHMGRTGGADCARPLTMLAGTADGAMSADGKVCGTYLHGLFANDAFRRAYLASFGITASGSDYRKGVEDALDAIAATLEATIDFDAMLRHATRR